MLDRPNTNQSKPISHRKCVFYRSLIHFHFIYYSTSTPCLYTLRYIYLYLCAIVRLHRQSPALNMLKCERGITGGGSQVHWKLASVMLSRFLVNKDCWFLPIEPT